MVGLPATPNFQSNKQFFSNFFRFWFGLFLVRIPGLLVPYLQAVHQPGDNNTALKTGKLDQIFREINASLNVYPHRHSTGQHQTAKGPCAALRNRHLLKFGNELAPFVLGVQEQTSVQTLCNNRPFFQNGAEFSRNSKSALAVSHMRILTHKDFIYFPPLLIPTLIHIGFIIPHLDLLIQTRKYFKK